MKSLRQSNDHRLQDYDHENKLQHFFRIDQQTKNLDLDSVDLHRHPKLSKHFNNSKNIEIEEPTYKKDKYQINIDKKGRKYDEIIYKNQDIFDNIDNEIQQKSQQYKNISEQKKYTIGVVIKRSEVSNGYIHEPNPNYMPSQKYFKAEKTKKLYINLDEIKENSYLDQSFAAAQGLKSSRSVSFRPSVKFKDGSIPGRDTKDFEESFENSRDKSIVQQSYFSQDRDGLGGSVDALSKLVDGPNSDRMYDNNSGKKINRSNIGQDVGNEHIYDDVYKKIRNKRKE